MKKLFKIFVDDFGRKRITPLKLFFNPEEVQKAESDGAILECLKHENGNMPYSSIWCQAFAEKPEGKELIQKIRGLCEGGGDKEKGQRKGGKTKAGKD